MKRRNFIKLLALSLPVYILAREQKIERDILKGKAPEELVINGDFANDSDWSAITTFKKEGIHSTTIYGTDGILYKATSKGDICKKILDITDKHVILDSNSYSSDEELVVTYANPEAQPFTGLKDIILRPED